MSNLRAGTPTRSKKRAQRNLNIYAVLAALLGGALLIGVVIGFIIGRSTAPAPQPAPVPSAESSVDAADSSVDAADTSAEGDVSMEPVTLPVADPEPEPDPEPAPPTGILVCIDPGHGGNDGGTGDPEKRLEKTDNLTLAEALKHEMELAGIEVVMTREEDKYVSLDDRCYIANRSGANYLISLHRNSFDGEVKGVEVWRSHNANDEALTFAENVHDGLIDVGISNDRGVRMGSQSNPNFDLQMNRNTEMPSVLVELGFIDVDEDNELYDTNMKAYCRSMAQAVLDTYAAYHG